SKGMSEKGCRTGRLAAEAPILYTSERRRLQSISRDGAHIDASGMKPGDMPDRRGRDAVEHRRRATWRATATAPLSGIPRAAVPHGGHGPVANSSKDPSGDDRRR